MNRTFLELPNIGKKVVDFGEIDIMGIYYSGIRHIVFKRGCRSVMIYIDGTI